MNFEEIMCTFSQNAFITIGTDLIITTIIMTSFLSLGIINIKETQLDICIALLSHTAEIFTLIISTRVSIILIKKHLRLSSWCVFDLRAR